jgi:hypothetical protein
VCIEKDGPLRNKHKAASKFLEAAKKIIEKIAYKERLHADEDLEETYKWCGSGEGQRYQEENLNITFIEPTLSSAVFSGLDETIHYTETSSIPRIVHNQSFISTRKGADGIVGPEAIFGRYDSLSSVLVSRSIGDKYGPRSCAATPEVCSHTIPRGEYRRFVLASDGFWDVVGAEFIQKTAYNKKYADNSTYASYLAQKAHRYRRKNNMRMDDITVCVVDVNIESRCSLPKNAVEIEKIIIFEGDGTEVEVIQDSCTSLQNSCSIM